MQDQAAYWGDVVCEAFTPLSPKRGQTQLNHSSFGEGFPGWVRSAPLAETNCAEIASCTQLLTHGPREVRRSPSEAVFVNLQLDGTCYGEQDDRRCIVPAGSFAVFDTTRPYRLEFIEPVAQSSWRVLSFRIPRDRWQASVGDLDFTATTIDTDGGAGGVASAMMASLWQNLQTLDQGAAARLESSFTDVLAAVTAVHSRAALESEYEHRDAALRVLVRRHIRMMIPLGRVTAADAARAVSISVRSLHRLFEAESSSFATCVREERLRGVMLELVTSPNSLPLNKIAARWGFYDNSHLTRVFQRHLGCTPTEYRASGGRVGQLCHPSATHVLDSIGS
ncbi:helix-turn-helix domain-containing protein [Mycolicibacterium sp. 120266]|uniref:AraC-like ligand-binding domain-containing protein n=1 Tax=Mycolicibacterium sp. 120266 TaxID=3090601 RepID=UPI00299D880C|nr:helix-turn-helix domain-containing protein [Mycolicibacterium sp. 120266]MDX1872945.1 helix-turn-helix domain-containing protein [Mycolicibacterium sp. 120266]